MSKQTYAQPQKREDDAPDEPLPVATNPETAARKAKLDDSTDDVLDAIDDLLDEIDGVLESNAEEFVNSYRQWGGQ
jgi:ubiquitin-like protein Pup